MIFLVGHTAVGKSTIAQILVERFGFLHVEGGDIVRCYKTRIEPEPNMSLKDWFGHIESIYGVGHIDNIICLQTVKIISQYLEKRGVPQDVVITGCRTTKGVDSLVLCISKEHVAFTSNVEIIYVQSDSDVMYKRYKSRGRNRDDKNMRVEEFSQLIQQEKEMGLDELIKKSSIRVENKYSTRSELEKRVVELTRQKLGYQENGA